MPKIYNKLRSTNKTNAWPPLFSHAHALFIQLMWYLIFFGICSIQKKNHPVTVIFICYFWNSWLNWIRQNPWVTTPIPYNFNLFSSKIKIEMNISFKKISSQKYFTFILTSTFSKRIEISHSKIAILENWYFIAIFFNQWALIFH